MTDCIHLSGLRVETLIGIMSYELNIKQPVVIDLDLYTSFSRAAKTDQISDAIDYKELSDTLLHFVSQSQFHLIEKLAEEIANWLFKKYSLEKVKVTVNKPRALMNASVGVSIERQKP